MAAYRHNFAVAVKVNGKVLRENESVVSLPYNSEYSVLLRNLSSVRALAKVSVNGVDATDGTSLIVEANGSIELKRFIKNGNREKGNSFRFIRMTEAVENHRGISLDDGIVRVEYQFEAPVTQTSYNCNHWYIPAYNWDTGYLRGTTYGTDIMPKVTGALNLNTQDYGNKATCSNPSGTLRSSNFIGTLTNSNSKPAQTVTTRGIAVPEVNTAGITVPGSENNQKFTTGAWFPVESESHVICLRLVGKVGEKEVVEPITVKHKPTCVTCGRVNKASSLFCNQCGTALTIFG